MQIQKLYFLIVLLIFTQSYGNEEVVQQRTRIVKITGNPQFRKENSDVWHPVTKNIRLQMGHDIQTNPRSKLIFSMEPAITGKLNPNTMVSLKKLLINEASKAIRMRLFVQNGTLRMEMPTFLGYKLLCSIETPSAKIYTRNAVMNIHIQDNITTLEVLKGSAKIRHNENELKTQVFSNNKAIVHPFITKINLSSLSEKPSIQMPPMTQKSTENISIAILNINAKMLAKEDLEPVSDFVAQEIEKQSNTEVLFLDDVRSMLRAEGVKNILDCMTDSCISKIGSYLGVDMVVLGKLGQVGKKYIFNLKMIDVLRDKTTKRVNTVIENDLGHIFKEVPKMVTNLIDRDMNNVTQQDRYKTSDSPGTTRTKTKNVMEYIFTGTFTMGSDMNVGDMDEWPSHKITITDFYLDKYEVTKEEFEAAMGFNPSGVKGCNSCPVDNVTWIEANEYCRKVKKRLPTEAEWEYACRSGLKTIFHYGNTLSSDKANFNGKKPFEGAPQGVARDKALPVGSFEPNKWKLYDMHGNIAEWCSDWYSDNYYGNSPGRDPQGPSEGKFKVVRGGSWRDDARTLRSANRISYNPAIRLKSIGFRCAKDAN